VTSTAPLHIPILRAGRAYASKRRSLLTDLRSGDPVADVSLANGGLIARDLAQAAVHRVALAALPTADLVSRCSEAASHFRDGRLAVDDGVEHSLDDYLSHLAATAGLPVSLGRRNVDKICGVLESMGAVLDGLTRGMDLAVLDAGWGEQDGRMLSFLPQADTLGAVLPNNSPGVHTLWLPAIPLKMPLALRPGSHEPWTPLRIARAFMATGVPPEAFGYYPSDHDGSTEILLRCGRAMVFGGDDTVGPWRADPRVEIHGAGRSKLLLLADGADDWKSHVDLMVASIADNGGRSCINASGVWTCAHGAEVAGALAERLAAIEPRPLDDPQAALAAFPEPRVAQAISAHIDRQLAGGGARDLTAELHGEDRVVEVDGCTFLRPTVVLCDSHDHPLANTEFLFPFVAVVEVSDAQQLLSRIGSSLVVTALTRDEALHRQLMGCTDIDRLNLGPVSTLAISWDQPHEGNLFEHLYRRRSLGRALQRA
jgi:acyl-CoA reductase-like NAD-dependent aldehyde dehydrogenase